MRYCHLKEEGLELGAEVDEEEDGGGENLDIMMDELLEKRSELFHCEEKHKNCTTKAKGDV
jgi:hypothetical protein